MKWVHTLSGFNVLCQKICWYCLCLNLKTLFYTAFPHVFLLRLSWEHSLDGFQIHSQNIEAEAYLKIRKGSFKRNCFTGWHHYNRFVYNNTGGYLRKNQTPITTVEQKIREISALMLVPGSSDSPGLKSKARGSRSKRDLPGNRCYPNQLSHL